ncbi:MAG: helix-turn-helix transcriptional regulator [Candidatus Protochlamydia sp.]|nr:helix-turn-helix transcriptional regulator [Candidatus Protochlamydia sp.]
MEEINIYSKIRDIRQAKGLTVNNLAEKIGEDYQKVGRIERGQRSLTIDYLMKFLNAFEIPIEDFFSKKDFGDDKDSKQSTLDLLNEIVIWVEENSSHLPFKLDAKRKGKFISKIYELVIKFPTAQHHLFLESFIEGVRVLK